MSAPSEKVNGGLWAVMRYLSLKGVSTKEIHKDMVARPEGENSNSIKKKWDADFRWDTEKT